jgi:hypothetical protein
MKLEYFLLFGFVEGKKASEKIAFIEFLGLGEKKTHSTSFLNFLAHFKVRRKKAGWKSRKLMREPNLKVNVYDFAASLSKTISRFVEICNKPATYSAKKNYLKSFRRHKSWF